MTGPPATENRLGPALPLSRSAPERRLYAIAGSVVTDFVGDALVNAANEGCVSGFGIDAAVNKEGGFELIQARKALGGCPTGQAKMTPSFGRLADRVSCVIHAVGPVFRKRGNRFIAANDKSQDSRQQTQDSADWADMDALLVSAYHAALEQAAQAGCRTVGFCLLSAGVFRGDRPLKDIAEIAVKSLTTAPPSCVESICLYAFTNEEQQVLKEITTRTRSLQPSSRSEGTALVVE